MRHNCSLEYNTLTKNLYIVHNNEMSEYDLLRLSNLKRNEDYIKFLGLMRAVGLFHIADYYLYPM
jgi:hypothetical protein